MQPHEERVVAEKKELDKKLIDLKRFCFGGNPTFHDLEAVDRNLLEDQYAVMLKYSDVLRKRIERFK